MTEDKSTPRPWKEGEGRVVYYGSVEQTERFPAGKYALVEFPAGPIGVTFGDVWNATPFSLVAVNERDALLKCAEALQYLYSRLVLNEMAINAVGTLAVSKAKQALAALEKANG